MNVRVARRSKAAANPGAWPRVLLVGLALMCAGRIDAADWAVPQAPLRFTFDLAGGPSHPGAGYLARIPDGGILPGPHPLTRVVAEDGTPVDSYALWHGPSAGLWIVFANPRKGRKVDVYVTSSPELQKWHPGSGLRPGPLLVTAPGPGGLGSAQQLAGLGRVGPRVHVRRKAGIPRAPLSIGGDDSGRPRPSSFYLHAYVVTTTPGRTWIAPVIQEGQSEVRIDGKPLVPRKTSQQWGGTGQFFNLQKGLHRVEMLCASRPAGAYTAGRFQGHVYLAWRTPGMPPGQLGGKKNRAFWAARVIKNHEIARSGRTTLREAVSKDGKPVALIAIEPRQNFWFAGEEQLGIYRFRALRNGAPADATYTWAFEQGARVTGPETTWLVPGLREHRVALTASSPKGKSTTRIPFFAYPTGKTSINDHSDRRAFRLALTTMLKAYPERSDPFSALGKAYWNNLMRTAEYGKGYPILEAFLGKRRSAAAKNLSRDELRLLEEIYLDVAPRVDPAETLEWIRRAQRSGAASSFADLRIREAEIYAVYLDQPETASKILADVVMQGREAGERARVRMGDLYLHRGDLNKATELYADVQKRVRHRRQGAAARGGGTIDNWKLGAIKDAAQAKNVKALVDSAQYLEARQALDRWERDFPLSKIGEDFILQEARLYVAMGDLKRAIWLLEPYCRYVDVSSYLPDAAVLLLDCMEDMEESPAKMKEMVDLLKERLKHHPVGKKMEWYLEEAKKAK